MVWAFPKVIKMAAHEFTAIISVEDRLPISQSCVIEFDLMHLFIEFDDGEIHSAATRMAWFWSDVVRN